MCCLHHHVGASGTGRCRHRLCRNTKILHFSAEGELAAPDGITLAVAALAIISKEGMYWYTRSVAKINSGALLADALHHRNDALTSVGSLIGISGAMLGYPILTRWPPLPFA